MKLQKSINHTRSSILMGLFRFIFAIPAVSHLQMVVVVRIRLFVVVIVTVE